MGGGGGGCLRGQVEVGAQQRWEDSTMYLNVTQGVVHADALHSKLLKLSVPALLGTFMSVRDIEHRVGAHGYRINCTLFP